MQRQSLGSEDILLPDSGLSKQLSYEQMLLLADQFLLWSRDSRLAIEKADSLIIWARGLYALADQVGEGWSPPKPEHVSLLGFLAQEIQILNASLEFKQ